MRILILNWRDVRSPRGGGAERLTHEVAKRLVARGHGVTWLSSCAEGLPGSEDVDGIRIERRGSEATSRFHALSLARRVRPDVILEEINTLPYFAPVWSRVPVLLYMNQLAREVWWYEAPPLIGLVGYASEPLYLRAYRETEAITISRSTLEDLRALGLRRRITVVPLAVETPVVSKLAPRSRRGHMVAIGRLAPSKRYDHAIDALAILRRSHPEAKLTLIGEGRERESLARHAAEASVSDAVVLRGSTSEAEKLEILDEADVLVGCSVREGWGLTVTEAAARGIPAVVYDIPGFRDAVVDERTGFLAEPTPAALARGVARAIDDVQLYDRIREAARLSVLGLTYEATADAFERALHDAARMPAPSA